MKKHECNYCIKHPGQACLLCGTVVNAPGEREQVYSTLYAAEFLLYAFHFERDHQADVIEKSPAHPLMMLVAEG